MMSLEKMKRRPKDWTQAATSTQRQTNNKATYDEGSCPEQSHWRGYVRFGLFKHIPAHEVGQFGCVEKLQG